jgi:uncharacterized protein
MSLSARIPPRAPAVAVALALVAAPTGAVAQRARLSHAALGTRVVERLVAGDFVEATREFDSLMQMKLPPAALREAWTELTRNVGTFVRRLDTRVEDDGEWQTVVVVADFARGTRDLRILLRDGRVTDMNFVRAVTQIPLARSFVGHLGAGRFTAAMAMFDEILKQLRPMTEVRARWRGILRQAGPLRSQRGVRTAVDDELTYVTVFCEFARATWAVDLAFKGPSIVHFGVRRDGSAPQGPPPYALPREIEEREVVVGGSEWALPGTLTLPRRKGPFPAVLLVQGAGPADRGESAGRNRPFRDLAFGLASRGIAVLRYDKRTLVYPDRCRRDPGFTVMDETVLDAIDAVALLRSMPLIDKERVFVLGHSMGGKLLPRIFVGNPRIAGLISLAGSTRPTEEILLEQMRYLLSLDSARDEEEKRRQLAELERTAARIRDPALPATSREVLLGALPPYWLDLRGYDPPALARKLRARMLILQGGRDYQVTVEDFARWRRALGDLDEVAFKLYPRLNHLFVAGEGRSSPAEYQIAGHVDREVVEDIARWIRSAR